MLTKIKNYIESIDSNKLLIILFIIILFLINIFISNIPMADDVMFSNAMNCYENVF